MKNGIAIKNRKLKAIDFIPLFGLISYTWRHGLIITYLEDNAGLDLRLFLLAVYHSVVLTIILLFIYSKFHP